MHMPPPVHGASMVGQWIHDSKIINDAFECHYINLSASKAIDSVGKFSLDKIKFLFTLLFTVLRYVFIWRPNLCYYTPTSVNAFGLYRDIIVVKVLRLCGQRVILHLHNKGVKMAVDRSQFVGCAYKQLYRGNKVILLAKELYDDVFGFVKPDDIYYLPNGIPQTLSDEAFDDVVDQRMKSIDEKKIRFLFLSNMMSEKGIWDLLDACKILKDRDLSFECHYVGNWGKDTTIESFGEGISSRELNDYIFVHGPKYGVDKSAFFCDSDIFVFPTYYHGETFGLVLVEAMEYGLPCISTFEGGVPSVVDNGKTGLLIESKSPELLADKMAYLASNLSERCELGANGRRRFLDNFTSIHFESRLKEIFNKEISN